MCITVVSLKGEIKITHAVLNFSQSQARLQILGTDAAKNMSVHIHKQEQSLSAATSLCSTLQETLTTKIPEALYRYTAELSWQFQKRYQTMVHRGPHHEAVSQAEHRSCLVICTSILKQGRTALLSTSL